MEPRPSSTSGSLSFSSGAMDSKSLAKNSSGSFAAVRGLRSGARRRRLGSARARRRPSVRTRARASGPGPAGRLGASHRCGVIVPRARRRRPRPARTYRSTNALLGGGATEGSSQRSLDVVGAERRLVRQRERARRFLVQGKRCVASGRRHIDSTLGFTIAAAAKTAVFIIVTARGCFSKAEPSSASMLARGSYLSSPQSAPIDQSRHRGCCTTRPGLARQL